MNEHEDRLYEMQVQPIDRTKPVIVPKGRKAKYNPDECSGKGAAARRLRAFRRKYGPCSEFITEQILNSKD